MNDNKFRQVYKRIKMPPQANPYQWQKILRLECATQKDINITSYGDWGLSLSRIPLNSLAHPLRDVVIKEISQKKNQYNEDGKTEQPEVQVDEYPDEKNIKSAFWDHVSVEIHESEEWFRNKYGFWEIEDFKVYDQDGNWCRFSFQTKNHAYMGHYGTS